ncbi:hypothetical protein AOZ06_41965 [Kibdelosporangium phytohabitans]|uniref:asparagine synthase (glutamine-hydrolyzing) n=2 Tax=Kibdelosporangium phytohabitans TaxID=860235 RepID=A0A0N9I3W7_9PSEU|nr:hypothetical protein AOZ06_41965 [Kibdelosporangium phytohabitans]
MAGIAGGVDFTAGTSDAVHFSGELSNAAELRGSLRRLGRALVTGDDAEIVLQAYLEWGPALVSRLDGAYAFAVWDARDRKLVMVRDRLGIKPLHYHPTPDGVLFGSSAKSILADPSVPRIVDVDGLRALVTSTLVPWKGIHSVEPGQIVTLSSAGVQARTYARLDDLPRTDPQVVSGLPTFSADVAALTDPALRREIVAAYDTPMGFGQADSALYLLAETLAAQSTVVLSGPLAAEVFGCASSRPHGDRMALMCPHLRGHLAGAGPAPAGLTRMAIDRVDRISTAVGLRVRMPFTDQRLITYIHDTTRAQRVPSANARYNAEIQRQAKEVLADRDHLAMSLIDWDWLTDAIAVDPAAMPGAVASGIEWILDLYHWADLYHPVVERPA